MQRERYMRRLQGWRTLRDRCTLGRTVHNSLALVGCTGKQRRTRITIHPRRRREPGSQVVVSRSKARIMRTSSTLVTCSLFRLLLALFNALFRALFSGNLVSVCRVSLSMLGFSVCSVSLSVPRSLRETVRVLSKSVLSKRVLFEIILFESVPQSL